MVIFLNLITKKVKKTNYQRPSHKTTAQTKGEQKYKQSYKKSPQKIENASKENIRKTAIKNKRHMILIQQFESVKKSFDDRKNKISKNRFPTIDVAPSGS